MNTYVVWSEKFETGIPRIDGQHKKLMGILNHLYAIHRDLDKEHVLELLRELAEYVHIHFSTEEELFEIIEMPKKILHIYEHNLFKKRLRSFILKYRQGKVRARSRIFRTKYFSLSANG